MAGKTKKILEEFENLSLTIQEKEMRSDKLCASLKLNGVEMGNIVSDWKIQQGAGGIPQLVLTIPLHNVPQIVL